MIQTRHSERLENQPLLESGTADFLAAAKERFESFSSAQAAVLEIFQETSQHWLERMQVEVKLASELASQLAAARSIPDAVSICQGWGSRRFEMGAEDAKHILDDAQKFVQTGADILANRPTSKDSEVRT